MANSKSDSKTPRTMDVVQPGKAVPPATSRPVIVTNRPILRQDPMMVSPDGMEKPEEPVSRPVVSRVGKTLTVLAPHQSKTAKAAMIAPLSASDKDEAKNAAPDQVADADKPAPSAMPQGRTPEEIANKKAIAVKTDQAEPEASAALSQPEALMAPSKESTLEPPASVEPQASEDAANKPEPTQPAVPVSSPASESDASAGTSSPAYSATLPTEDGTSTDADNNGEASDNPDGQLAPNKTLDDAKKKADDAEAARVAEQEQIIASRRYYLPVTNTDARRGAARSLLVLLLVLVLTAVWFDVVLDAGILHIGGLQPLTHFFR